ncbi:hypothetical protein [Caballeronia sp. dw_19]|uniref:hypothetical protein n=1 Tax=Caballeronia sp. dw_19 TaxID=2719791 RepID=UPI001BD24708|nr:hypothetical protein [Caballeronia sp. dw_19]
MSIERMDRRALLVLTALLCLQAESCLAQPVITGGALGRRLTAPLPYFASANDADRNRPAGVLKAGDGVCVDPFNTAGQKHAWVMTTTSGQTIYAFPFNFRGDRDTSLGCPGDAGLIKEEAAKATALAPQSAADTVTDPEALREIADMLQYNRSPPYIGDMAVNSVNAEKIQADPYAASIATKLIVAQGFDRRGTTGPKGTSYEMWKIDPKHYSDIQKARAWAERALEQIKREHPDVDPVGLHSAPSDRDGTITHIASNATNILQTTPSPQVYQAYEANPDRPTPEGGSECARTGREGVRLAKLKKQGYSYDAADRNMKERLTDEQYDKVVETMRGITYDLVLGMLYNGPDDQRTPEQFGVAVTKWCIRNGGR